MSDRTTSKTAIERNADEGIASLVAIFERRRGEFEARLPSTITVESFKDAFVTALTVNRRLLEAETASLFLALQKCADAGLKPDGQEAVITIFGDDPEEGDGGGKQVATTGKKFKRAVYMPMVWGLVKLIRNAGGVKHVTAELVYRGEHCKIVLGDEPRFEHERSLEPDFNYDYSQVIGAYAIVSYLDGSVEREWMNRTELARVAAVNPSKKGPRAKWPDQMDRKAPLRRLAKRLRKSKEMERFDAALDADDTAEILDGVAEPVPEQQRMAAPQQRQQPAREPSREGGPPNDGYQPPGDTVVTKEPSKPDASEKPQPGDALVLYGTDEFGEALVDDNGEFVIFSDPVVFVRWLHAGLMSTQNPETLLENNRDALGEARAADPAAVDPLVADLDNYLTNRKKQAEHEAAKEDAVETASTEPQAIPAPAAGAKNQKAYLTECGEQIALCASPEAVDAWRKLNLPTYQGKAVEPGINRLITERHASFAPVNDTVDPNERDVRNRIADIKGTKTRDELKGLAGGMVMTALRDRLIREGHPEMWEQVKAAGIKHDEDLAAAAARLTPRNPT